MDYVDELCSDLELTPHKDKNGSCLLSIGESLKIRIKNLNPGTYFASQIAPCPKVKREDLFIYLMKANLFGQGTLGAALGISADETTITLSIVLPYEMDYPSFKGAVEDFANIIDYWKQEIDQHLKLAKGGVL